MMRMRVVVTAAGVAALIACGGGTSPAPSLVGTWDLVSVSDSGTVGAGTGTVVFSGDGAFVIRGTVTYPGQAPDSVSASGTWVQSGTTLTWTIGASVTTFQLAFTGSEVTLTVGYTVTRLRRHA